MMQRPLGVLLEHQQHAERIGAAMRMD